MKSITDFSSCSGSCKIKNNINLRHLHLGNNTGYHRPLLPAFLTVSLQTHQKRPQCLQTKLLQGEKYAFYKCSRLSCNFKFAHLQHFSQQATRFQWSCYLLLFDMNCWISALFVISPPLFVCFLDMWKLLRVLSTSINRDFICLFLLLIVLFSFGILINIPQMLKHLRSIWTYFLYIPPWT